jgi:hypothetical protein
MILDRAWTWEIRAPTVGMKMGSIHVMAKMYFGWDLEFKKHDSIGVHGIFL